MELSGYPLIVYSTAMRTVGVEKLANHFGQCLMAAG